MKLCQDCAFYKFDNYSGRRCARKEHDSAHNPVTGDVRRTGDVSAERERDPATFLLTFRCGPKGRHFKPRASA